MRVLVLLEVGADVRIPPQRDPRSGRVREEWLIPEVDPASARALDLALALTADRPNGRVTVVHLGPPEHDPFLRHALARGCAGAIRLWDGEAAQARTAGKALVLAAAAAVTGYDLILTGNTGVIRAAGQLGVLLAGHLGIACVTEVGDASLSADSRRLQATRHLDRGIQERIEATLPLVAAVLAQLPSSNEGIPQDVPARARLVALEQDIIVWSLADLGVGPGAVAAADRPLVYGPARPRRWRFHPVAAPDPALPAFDRILGLVRGSIRLREGRVVRHSAEEAAQEVFEILRDEGWLDHLRPTDPAALSGGDDSPAPEADGRR